MVFVARAAEMLAAFIRDEVRIPGQIRKDSIKRSVVVVNTIIFGEIFKRNRAFCKIKSHTVNFRVEVKA